MKIYPHLAYIVVQRPFREDEGQKLSKAAGFGLGAGGDIDVAAFLDREGAETFRARNPIRTEYHEVVEVVVIDHATFAKLEADLAISEEQVKALTYDLHAARNPTWMPADLPPVALPDNFGRSRDVLVVTNVGRKLVAHAHWAHGPKGPADRPQWYDDDLNPIDNVTGWTSLPRHPSERNLK